MLDRCARSTPAARGSSLDRQPRRLDVEVAENGRPRAHAQQGLSRAARIPRAYEQQQAGEARACGHNSQLGAVERCSKLVPRHDTGKSCGLVNTGSTRSKLTRDLQRMSVW